MAEDNMKHWKGAEPKCRQWRIKRGGSLKSSAKTVAVSHRKTSAALKISVCGIPCTCDKMTSHAKGQTLTGFYRRIIKHRDFAHDVSFLQTESTVAFFLENGYVMVFLSSDMSYNHKYQEYFDMVISSFVNLKKQTPISRGLSMV